jgi:hypothetical protein
VTSTLSGTGLVLALTNSGDYKAGQVFGAVVLLILGAGLIAWAAQRIRWARTGRIRLTGLRLAGVCLGMILGLFAVAADLNQVVTRGWPPRSASSDRSESTFSQRPVQPAATIAPVVTPPIDSATTATTMTTLPRLSIDNSIPIATSLRASVEDFPSTGYLAVVLDWTQPSGYPDVVVYRGEDAYFAHAERVVAIVTQPGHAADTSVQHGHRYSYFVTVARNGGSSTSLPVLAQVTVP